MPLTEALLACHRFGMGARPGDCAAAAADPRGWLRAGLQVPATPGEFRRLPGSAAVSVKMAESRRGGQSMRRTVRQELRASYREEAIARTLVGVNTTAPLYERLVRFFSDVLTVSIARVQCFGLVGPFEREVIRPGVLGAFPDLLVAATKHPAMQVYLDNFRSIGPDSPVGSRRERGLNENHAREILELHTLGVDSYTQDDVVALANMLTGWTVGEDGTFEFARRRHQPGAQTLLGVRYSAATEEQAESALRDLALHPATARRLSWRMARHFVADEPPAAVIADLEAAYLRTGGSIRAMANALIDSPAAWGGELTKIRRPEELLIASLRALVPAGRFRPDDEKRERIAAALTALGQAPWSAPSPEGWPDTAADWLGGEALLTRLKWSWELGRIGATLGTDPKGLADDILPGALSRRTLKTLKSAPDRQTGLALLLASAPFQRR